MAGSPGNDGTDAFGNTQGGAPNTPQAPPVQDDPADMGMPSVIEPIVIDDCGDSNPAGLSPEQVDTLRAGGGTPPRLLYPYDATVFPRGMVPPALMWDGNEAEAVYVHIESTHFEWFGCMTPQAPNYLDLPPEVWEAATARTLGPGDPYTIEVTPMVGGAAHGPVAISVVIAQATINGSIYYNSYLSAAAGGFAGSILRIPPGGNAELFLGGLAGCYGCHTVSANGERLISYVGVGGLPGASYALDPTTQPNPPMTAPSPFAGFTGLSPDGSVYVAGARPVGLVAPQGTPGEPPNDSALYETDTGTVIAGSGVPPTAMMPTFSSDGTVLAFSDGAATGQSLVLMDFDQAARMAANPRTIHTDDQYVGWPFVLPDRQAVVFTRGANSQYSGLGAGVIPGTNLLGPESNLYMVDVDTGQATILAKAMGLNDARDTTGYVPFGAEDLGKNYYPTVSPVAAGGYFWVFFDSIRHYGNAGQFRQLWGAAISISPDGDYSTDRSHPAFYLPGQEFASGNHRAFAALDACVMDGEDCLTGIDCCGGFCFIPEIEDNEFGIEPVGTCTSDVPECARRDERCLTDDDCCSPDPGEPFNTCIAGFCAFIPLE
ncbi:MAG: dickkopf-related protein [Myxococcales bacterium]|nr:dickkopf-related protein [Myxococcales bacterium]